MKKKRLLMSLASLVIIAGAGGLLASCGSSNDSVTPNEPSTGTEPTWEGVTSFDIELTSSKSLVVGESIHVVTTDVTPSTESTNALFEYESSDPLVATVDENGKITALGVGETTISVTCEDFGGYEEDATKEVTITVVEGSTATGAHIYAGESYEDKLEILGKLEEYAYDNNLTGIPFYENGGYVMYDERVEKGTENYISGYGFGILEEGKLLSPNENYTDEGTENYYHTYFSNSHEGSVNYLDDVGSTTNALYEHIAGQYYSVKMNDTKDGYEWYPQLALEVPSTDNMYSSLDETQLNRPIALNKNSAGLATQFRIYLKTGYEYDGTSYSEDYEDRATDGLYYTTSESSRYYDAFNGRPVSILDYVYPYIFLINGYFNLARHADFISASYDSTLKGAASYSAATTSSANISATLTSSDPFFSLVGLDIGLDEDPSTPDAPCITFTLDTPLTEFDAMYALSDTLTSPIPLDFITTIASGTYTAATSVSSSELDDLVYDGLQNAYGITSQSHGDVHENVLSVGEYVLDSVGDYLIEYSRNDSYCDTFEPGRFDSSIEGIAYHFYEAGESKAFEEFLNGNLDAASIYEDYISQYKDDPRTTTTQGDTVLKLNVNTTTQEEWEAIFGVNGTNPNGQDEEGYYQVNPLMSNDKFVNALSFAFDRETYADNRGIIPSQDYFADAYTWQPEEGLSYNDTAQHQGNLADKSPETYGYNFDVAVALMDQAIEEVIADPDTDFDAYEDYTTAEYGGTDRDSNNLGVIEISWRNTTDPQDYGNDILAFWQTAFEATDAYQKGFRIVFTQDQGSATASDVYYNVIFKGNFDLAFGAITGDSLDPLGFMEVLKSDNSSGFTLNWIGDTDELNEEEGKVIYYDGLKWSYDGLWEAANNGVVIGSDGKVLDDPLALSYVSSTTNSNSSLVEYTITYTKAAEAAATQMKFAVDSNDVFTFVGTSGSDTVVVNLALSTYATLYDTSNGELNITDELPTGSGTLKLYVPLTLTSSLTGLSSDVTTTDLTDTYVVLGLYTTYGADEATGSEGYTISSTYYVEF